jgi:hypothetical protein
VVMGACKTPVVSFLLLNLIIAPLLALLLALVFGAVLAYFEEWAVFGMNGERLSVFRDRAPSRAAPADGAA